jgi:hypothetical protein
MPSDGAVNGVVRKKTLGEKGSSTPRTSPCVSIVSTIPSTFTRS